MGVDLAMWYATSESRLSVCALIKLPCELAREAAESSAGF